MVWFAYTYVKGNISKGMPVECICTTLQKVAEGVKMVKEPTFNDAEID